MDLHFGQVGQIDQGVPAPDFVAKGHVAIESVLDALAWVDIRGVLGTGLLGPALLLILALAGTAFLPRDRGSSADAPPTAISAFESFAYAALIVLQLSIALYRLAWHAES